LAVSAGGNIGGDIKAAGNIGQVAAGGNIGLAFSDGTTSGIEATAGNLGSVTAGLLPNGVGAGGNLVASLKAGIGIGDVTAWGGFDPADANPATVPLRGPVGQLNAAAPTTPAGSLPAPQIYRLDDLPLPKPGL